MRQHATALLLRAFALFAIVALVATAGCDKDSLAADTRLPVEIAGRAFSLELALTPKSRFQGLSDRESIDPEGGMLFAFTAPERLSFVMRRCVVPIDIIFLDPAGRVVAMYQMQVEPDPNAPDHQLRRYTSKWPAQFAIELKGGTLPELNVQLGDKIDLPVDQLRQLAE